MRHAWGNPRIHPSPAVAVEERGAFNSSRAMNGTNTSSLICGILSITLMQCECCSPLPQFLGIPKEKYWGRASAVCYRRNWFQGKREGSSCDLETERCSLDLLCVGPFGMKQYHRPIQHYQDCDREYKVCEEGLVLIDHRCLKEKKATVVKEILSVIQDIFLWLGYRARTQEHQASAISRSKPRGAMYGVPAFTCVPASTTGREHLQCIIFEKKLGRMEATEVPAFLRVLGITFAPDPQVKRSAVSLLNPVENATSFLQAVWRRRKVLGSHVCNESSWRRAMQSGKKLCRRPVLSRWTERVQKLLKE